MEQQKTDSVHLAAVSGQDVHGSQGRTEAASVPWSTNGTFVWLTSDRETISKRGDELAFEPPLLSGWQEREAICHRIVRAVNNHAALVDALDKLEVAANTVSYCYADQPGNFAAALRDMREYADAARSALAAATAKGSE